jgi:SAM-dependent methyltransferase
MEIGCSSGFQLKEIHKQFKEAVVIGADVVKEPLYRLARTTPEIPLIRFDLLRCPLPQGCVDMLIMSNVLEHILEDTTALKNAFMLLKPGGSIIIEVPAYQFLYDAYDKAVCHFRRYSRPELQKKLQEVGFVINRSTHLGFIVFPAFLIVKMWNKIMKRRPTKTLVAHQAKATSKNILFDVAMRLEAKLLSKVYLPFGIRVLVTAYKPEY